MKKEKKTLTLRIKKVWLEEIVFGKKRTEYRDNTLFYWSRLVGKDDFMLVYDTVSFYCPIGATGKILRAEVEFKKTVQNKKTNQNEIHLGKILSHNLPKFKKQSK